MNRALSYIVTIILTAAFTLIGDMTARAPRLSISNTDNATSGPFRDGSYQAKLDVENGRKPHLSSARWSTSEDRASYSAGYQQAYAQFRLANPGRAAGAELPPH